MKTFRKRAGIVVLALLFFACIGAVSVYFQYQHTSVKRLPDRYRGSVEKIQCKTDRDGDGVDDQSDILDGAWAYLNSKHPKYKSVYYAETGWSDDEYGVCTDVVANALLAAGYNLQELVDADIKTRPEDYDIEDPDPMIDFRRVRNLIVHTRRRVDQKIPFLCIRHFMRIIQRKQRDSEPFFIDPVTYTPRCRQKQRLTLFIIDIIIPT